MDKVQIEILDSDNSIQGILDVGDIKNFNMSLTSSIANLKDINERSGSFSTSFKIPSTKSNDDLLEHIYLSQHKNYKDFDAEKDCRIRINGVTIETGRLQITRMSRVGRGADDYSFKFFGNNMDWVLQMRGKTTQDLPYLDTSLTYDDSTVRTSWSNVGGSDLPVFSILNRGQRESANAVNVKDVFPDYFVLDYLNNAFKSVGYNFSSTFFNTSAQKQLIIPFFGKNFNDTERAELNKAIVQLDSSATNFDNTFTTAAGYYTNILDLNPLVSTSNYGDELRINYTANTFTTHSASSGGGIQATGSTKDADFDDTPAPLKDNNSNFTSNVYTVRYDNRYRVRFITDYTFTRDPSQSQLNPSVDYYVKLTRGSNYSFIPITNYSTGTVTSTTVSATREELRYQREVRSTWFNCQAGDELEIVYACNVRRGLGNYPASSYYMKLTHAQKPITFEPYPFLDEGDTFNWKTVSDDTIDMLDIVIDIGRLFNIYWRTDNVTKTVYAEPRDDFYNALTTATNETDRIDPSKTIEVFYNSQSYKRTHKFKYAEDSKDGYLKEHNEKAEEEWCYYEHSFPSKFKEGTTELSTKVISATHYLEDIYSGGDIPMLTARLWEDPVQLKPILSNFIFMKPRILYYNYSTQQDIEGNSRNFQWRTESTKRTTIPYALPFPIIEESVTLADVDGELTFKEVSGNDGLWYDYFRLTAAEIRDGKRINLYLRTDLVDYRSLDFRKPIYFDNRYPEVEGYWRIEKVSGFNPTGKNVSCKYELIQARTFNQESHSAITDSTTELLGNPTNTGIENGNNTPSTNRTINTGYGNTTPDAGNMLWGTDLSTDGNGVLRIGTNNLDVSTDLFQLGMGTPEEPFSLLRQTRTGDIYFNGVLLNPDAGFGGAVIDVTSDITVDESVDTCLIDASSGNITVKIDINVPDGHVINMKRMDNSGNTVTIQGDDDGAGSNYPIDDDVNGFMINYQYTNAAVKKTNINEFIKV